MKKIINSPDSVIEDYIAGLVGSVSHLTRIAEWPIVVRGEETRKPDDRVVLISGGGSGHEPAHAGFVGRGMLDAAVLGPVFTSPSVDSVYAAIKATATPAGMILIVKNYTGDRLNFGLAAEMARAEGIQVEMVVVADDAALGDSSRAGRRGLSATVLVHKIAGAAAEAGLPIARIVTIVERFLAGTATMGVALGPCTVPGADAPNFELAPDEVEWGLGIHGEPGSERGRILPSRQIAARLVATLQDDRDWRAGTDVVALVNSLGGTPDLDLRILQGDVLAELRSRGLTVKMTWAGPFLTSLEMPGASLTVGAVDGEILGLLAAPAEVVAFPSYPSRRDIEVVRVLAAPHPYGRPVRGVGSPRVRTLHDVVAAVAEAIVAAEMELTTLDREVGDGDLGTNLARGASAVLSASDVLRTQGDERAYLAAIADILRREVGGTSGPLYSLLLLALAEALPSAAEPTSADWSQAAAAGVARVRAVGGAVPGDSTMVDALQPAVDALVANPGDAHSAAHAARVGAESTVDVRPSLGRSSYVGDRAVGVPDPGAVAIAIQFEALAAFLGRDDGEGVGW